MFFRRAAAAAALVSAVSAAPSEVLPRGGDAVIQYVDPCSVDETVVHPHEWMNKGVLPPKVEECLVANLGPTFVNAFYAAYTTVDNSVDNSVDINAKHVDIDHSIVGNENDHNVIGNGNAVANGDNNDVGSIGGDGIVGTGNGNGNGNIDHSNVNSTISETNGNDVDIKGSAGGDLINDTKNNGNTNSSSEVTDSGNETSVDADNSGNDLSSNDSGNDSSTNDSNNNNNNNNGNNPTKRDLGSAATKRHVESCFGLKCMGSVQKVLPCIFTATKTNQPAALMACGVPKQDLCSCIACLPADVADYVDEHCKGRSPLDGVKVTEELLDADFVESTDNNVRAFLGLITRSELEAVRSYEKRTAARIGARSEDSCVLGTRCGENCCCYGTCGLKGGLTHCYGMC